ncbi:MAG: prepilin-type N-terminal cleavage/methylation domain-containing protein [Candidatus Omnitrophica bacterium]|nr:prepilin-type N-terminal cleavage/methylation domain-containing protein [Candidatus Omnitrophota bacterium]
MGRKQKNFSYRYVKGFTIIELIIAVAIFSIIIAAIHQVAVIGERTWDRGVWQAAVQQMTRSAYRDMLREIRSASLSSLSTTSVITSSCNDTEEPDADACDKVTFDTPDDTGVMYYLDDGQIVRENSLGARRIITGNVEELLFCCPHSGSNSCECDSDHDYLDIRIKIKKITKGRDINYSLRSQVGVRND